MMKKKENIMETQEENDFLQEVVMESITDLIGSADGEDIGDKVGILFYILEEYNYETPIVLSFGFSLRDDEIELLDTWYISQDDVIEPLYEYSGRTWKSILLIMNLEEATFGYQIYSKRATRSTWKMYEVYNKEEAETEFMEPEKEQFLEILKHESEELDADTEITHFVDREKNIFDYLEDYQGEENLWIEKVRQHQQQYYDQGEDYDEPIREI